MDRERQEELEEELEEEQRPPSKPRRRRVRLVLRKGPAKKREDEEAERGEELFLVDEDLGAVGG